MPDPAAPAFATPLQLRFKPEGWFNKHYRVTLPHGPTVATLDLSTWRTWAEITLPTDAYTIRRDKRDGALVLYHAGTPEAQAVREGMFTVRYRMEWAGGKGELRMHKKERGVILLSGAEGEVARMVRTGWTKRHIAGTFPAAWPLERALFVGVVALLAWITQDAAAAAAAGA